MRGLRLLFVLCLTACDTDDGVDKPAIDWKASYSEAECKALMAREAFIERCGDGNLERAVRTFTSDVTSCMPFSHPEEFAGLWFNSLESSEFFADVTDPAQIEDLESDTWLSDKTENPEAIAAGGGAGDVLYFVRFIGRQSLCDDAYGHMGAYPKEVILERPLELRRLTPPRTSPPAAR